MLLVHLAVPGTVTSALHTSHSDSAQSDVVVLSMVCIYVDTRMAAEIQLTVHLKGIRLQH